MKKTGLLIFLFIIVSITVLRAQLFFCGKYTDAGEPIGASNTLKPSENGGHVYLLFSNKNKIIHPKTLYIVVMKESNKEYIPYQKGLMSVGDKKTWAAVDWHFAEPGKYKVSVMDNGHEMGNGFLSVLPKSTESGHPNMINIPDKSYYNATTAFCESVIDGKAINEGTVFKPGPIYIHVFNEKPLLTDSIIVDVMKKAYETDSFTIYITTKYYGAKVESKTAFLPIEFDESGQYKVSIYNRRMQRISEGFVMIR